MGKYKIEARIGEKEAGYWKNFRNFVFQKHGKLHGVLGEELTKAMELYLKGYSQEEGGRTHKTSKEEKEDKKKKPKKKNSGMYANGGIPESLFKIMDDLWNRGYELQTTSKEIRKSICRKIGTDQKTERRYIQLLQDFGLIEHRVGMVYNIKYNPERDKS